MKKVITAIGKKELYNKLKETKKCLLLTNDISYDEELIEFLERGESADILFLCSQIIKNYDINEFISIVKLIQKDIFIVLFKEPEVEITFEENENITIFDSFNIDEKTINAFLQKEINENTSSEEKAKTIAISGTRGVGKSTFSAFLARNIEKLNTKVLLIDFDLSENHIRTLLKIKKQPHYNGNIRDIIINSNKNLDVICHLDMIFENKTEIDFFKIQKILKEFKKEYDLIIIDTSSDLDKKYTRRIFYNSDEIIFLIEPNILGVKKAKNILEVFENDWQIQNHKIKLILNKVNIYQISNTIIEEIFPNFDLIGKMKYKDSYNLLINKNIDKKEIRKEYIKIYSKI